VAGHGGIEEELVNQHHRHDNNAGRRQQSDDVRDFVTVPQLLNELTRAGKGARGQPLLDCSSC